MKKTKLHNQYRNFNIRSGAINEKDRTVSLSFSSEEPVSRYFGQEILDHNPSSVDLSYLRNGAAVLEDHNEGQIGRVMDAEIKEGRGYATVKLSRSQRGEEIWQDVLDGIRTSISFGYQVRSYDEVDEADEPTFVSRNWMPFEISFVGVPADVTVGVGRSKDDGVEVEVPDSFRTLDNETKDIDIKLDTKEPIVEVEEKKETVKGANPRLKWLSLLESKYNK